MSRKHQPAQPQTGEDMGRLAKAFAVGKAFELMQARVPAKLTEKRLVRKKVTGRKLDFRGF